jgi:hypothetical protein
MKDPEPEDLLWELPRAEGQDDAPTPPDSVLIAYRAGSLPAREGTRLEWGLAGSRSGRARLAELGGIRLDAPARGSGARRHFVAAILAVAATLVLATLFVWKRGEPVLPTPHPLPEFALRVEGLASRRDVAGGAQALADGRVRVVVEARGEAIPGLSFAAYRLDESGLTRLIEPAEIAVNIDRGSAILTASAERLVGPALGTRPFFVVVTDRALPGRLTLKDEVPEAALEHASGGRVYRVPLTIVTATDGAP